MLKCIDDSERDGNSKIWIDPSNPSSFDQDPRLSRTHLFIYFHSLFFSSSHLKETLGGIWLTNRVQEKPRRNKSQQMKCVLIDTNRRFARYVKTNFEQSMNSRLEISLCCSTRPWNATKKRNSHACPILKSLYCIQVCHENILVFWWCKTLTYTKLLKQRVINSYLMNFTATPWSELKDFKLKTCWSLECALWSFKY